MCNPQKTENHEYNYTKSPKEGHQRDCRAVQAALAGRCLLMKYAFAG
jgi:hypothetical protein